MAEKSNNRGGPGTNPADRARHHVAVLAGALLALWAGIPTLAQTPTITPNYKDADIRQIIEAQADTVSVILATHLFDDIREICQRVAIIADGSKVTDLPVTPDLDLMSFFQTPRSGAA